MFYSSDKPETGEYLLAYRLIAPRYATAALSGEGSRLNGGRWNSIGRPVTYLAGSRALAALELLVHLTTPESRKIIRTLVEVRIPLSLIGGKLWKSEGWRDDPPTSASVQQGDEWLEVGSTVGVAVPSAIIPEENNYLINPLHSDFGKIKIVNSQPFSFDHRLIE